MKTRSSAKEEEELEDADIESLLQEASERMMVNSKPEKSGMAFWKE